MAALSRFISRLGEKALPLYRLLRRTEHFEWTDAATAGLEEIKAILATNPVLAAPNLGEPMLLYIAATHQVVSAVLFREFGFSPFGDKDSQDLRLYSSPRFISYIKW